MTVEVINTQNAAILSNRCKLATSIPARTMGLLNRSSLETGEGLLIRPCSSVHCFFMRFPIDVLFLDKENRVLKMYAPLKQWRASSIVRGARQTLEVPAGTINRTGTQVGDVLHISA
jgi:hypothetical protein